MSQRDFNLLLTSLDARSPEQLAALRRELDGKLAMAATKLPAGSDRLDRRDARIRRLFRRYR